MSIFELFNIPTKAQADRRIFVKDILSRLELNSRDKQSIEKTISTIHVKGVLNESTSNIWSYVDDIYYYKEIIVFNVVLKDSAKHGIYNKFKNIKTADKIIKENNNSKLNDLDISFDELQKQAKSGALSYDDYTDQYNNLIANAKKWGASEKVLNSLNEKKFTSKNIDNYRAKAEKKKK